MKKIVLIAAALLLFSPFAQAADPVQVGDLKIEKAWSRASTGLQRPGGAFLTIHNPGAEADRLIAAETPAAARTELHTHIMEDGMMKMRQVPAIEVPAAGMTLLKPGSFHVMMFKLHALLKEGDMFPLTLTFEKAGKATVTVHVGKAGAMMQHDHSSGHMKKSHSSSNSSSN